MYLGLRELSKETVPESAGWLVHYSVHILVHGGQYFEASPPVHYEQYIFAFAAGVYLSEAQNPIPPPLTHCIYV